jgi:hypothetical protein
MKKSLEKYSIFYSISLMTGNDQYGRRLFSWGKPLRFSASVLYSEMRNLVYMRYPAMDKCPLDRMCKVDNIVYKAMVTTTDDGNTKEYIGMTADQLKERDANHKTSIRTSTTTRLIQSFRSTFGV